MSGGDDKPDELPEITAIDAEAQEFLETRRANVRPHRYGWWRNKPNPHSVGNEVKDEEL